MHSFFVEHLAAEGCTLTLAKRESDHLFKTLRARPDDLVELLDGKGGRAEAVVLADKTLEIRCVTREPEPAGKLRLYCAPPRKAKFDVLLKQAAELGVWEIQLIRFERNVAQPEGSERWQLLLQEGCKQSKNPFLPMVLAPVELEEMFQLIRSRQEKAWFGAIRSGSVQHDASGNFAWIVGPEGGFTEDEKNMLINKGAKSISLGNRILRAETAAIMLTTLVLNILGEF
jgi:16S rRNA (uracil1498-N3)-methyltransferase